MNCLSTDRRRQVLHLLVEGNSIRSIERLTKVNRNTIMNLLVFAGNFCGDFLYHTLRGLRLRHIEVDEIWTFVLKKQAHHAAGEDDLGTGDQYVFVAIDQDTKLIPTFLIGKRTGLNCERFMLDLAGRVITPRPGQPRIKLQISSDGFAAYPGAVDLAFANTVDYGFIVKDFKDDGQEAPGRYGPPKINGTARQVVQGDIDPMSICTSYAERNNLTIRTFLRRFTRLSLGFSKKLENLVAAVCLHMAHYNFCRRHGTLRMTPAMAANVTGEMWDVGRLMKEIGI